MMTLSLFNFHCFNNTGNKSDKHSVGSGNNSSSKQKRAEGKEIIPVVSSEKGSSNIGGEVIRLDNKVMPNGEVIDLNNHSAGLKSPTELIGTSSSSKKSNSPKTRYTGCYHSQSVKGEIINNCHISCLPHFPHLSISLTLLRFIL